MSNSLENKQVTPIYLAKCKCRKYVACESSRYTIRERAIDHAEICDNNVVLYDVVNNFHYFYVTPDEREPMPPKTASRLLMESRLRQTINNCFSD